MSGNTSGGILDEILRVAKGIYATADVRKKPFSLNRMELPTLYSIRAGSARQGNYDTTLHVALEIVKREVEAARNQTGNKAYDRAVLALSTVLREAAKQSKGTGGSASAMTRDLVSGVNARPKWLDKVLSRAPKAARPNDVKMLTGLDVYDWNAFVVWVVEEADRRRTPLVDRIDLGTPKVVDLNVATRLSRVAAREEEELTSSELPIYDTSERSVRITRTTVTGFRGSSGTVTLDLTKNGKPVDVLLWGDNGVGKSTIVDGMEFALQRRVDRSADFNSTLRSAVRNLFAPAAEATVRLSDGSIVERSLVINKAGRDEPSSLAVRPGFRIAPLVIRRSDILRFLDTDALSRGTVFFDYFPDPEGTLGERPDEELKMLEEERFLLRVARDDLAGQLSNLYPDTDTDFTNAARLEEFVRGLLEGADPDDFENPRDALPEEVCRVITELRTSQQRSAAIKKKLDQGIQTLNPVAYKSQLERVVPILRTVTEDLTTSFKRVTRAEHVTAIKVLVAKSGPVSLDVVVEFDNGTSALPQQAFSEGYKDLIALLFLLAVTKKASKFGQAKVLVLDDALQSVDATIRLGVMDYVLEQFKDWQLIITGHDRAWFAQLRGLFTRRGRNVVERTITRWSFSEGIEVAGGMRSRADSLREALTHHDERLTASATGLLLEEIGQELSWRIEASVTRREGDRYTLGDLWPGVGKLLRSTSLKDTVRAINMGLDIRNLLGAHYNEWADGIPWSDIQNLAEDVLKVYEAAYCAGCASWIRKSGREFSCHCGAVSLS